MATGWSPVGTWPALLVQAARCSKFMDNPPQSGWSGYPLFQMDHAFLRLEMQHLQTILMVALHISAFAGIFVSLAGL